MIGIELQATQAHAAWGTRRVTLPFDASAPDLLVAQLRGHFGRTRGIALSIGLAHLWIKRIDLPPASTEVRRSIVLLEPDRFFPVMETPFAVAVHHDFAFAMDAHQLERWVSSFETWATVRAIEPAPLSLARVHRNGTLRLPANANEQGMMSAADGVLTVVRRAPEFASLPEAEVPADYDAALSVPNANASTMLVSKSLQRRFARRRITRRARRAAVVAASLLVTALAIDGVRARKLGEIEARLRQIEPLAEPVLRQQAVSAQQSAIKPANVLGMMQLLTRRLPPGALILNLQMRGGTWQVDGTAPDAAALVPLLDQENRLQDVHMLSGSSRFQEDDRQYETFSIAFRDAGPN